MFVCRERIFLKCLLELACKQNFDSCKTASASCRIFKKSHERYKGRLEHVSQQDLERLFLDKHKSRTFLLYTTSFWKKKHFAVNSRDLICLSGTGFWKELAVTNPEVRNLCPLFLYSIMSVWLFWFPLWQRCLQVWQLLLRHLLATVDATAAIFEPFFSFYNW